MSDDLNHHTIFEQMLRTIDALELWANADVDADEDHQDELITSHRLLALRI